MKKIDKDTVSITLGGEEKEIFFSFGIDVELTKIFTDMICAGDSGKGDIFTDTISKVVAEVAEDDKLDTKDIKRLLEETFKNTQENTVKMAEMIQLQTMSYSDAYSRVCSILLTDRNEDGQVIKPVLTQEILYGKKYQTEEAKKELRELFEFAQTRFTEYIGESEKN